MLQIVLLAGKFVFLVILYLFLYRVIRSTTRELRTAAPGFQLGANLLIWSRCLGISGAARQ